MKKIYQAPTVVMIGVEPSFSLLTGSDTGLRIMNSSADKEAEILSRESDWDDDYIK